MTPLPAFFEIGTRTYFSFLEGAAHPQELIATAREIGLSGLGVADRNTVAGVVRTHVQAKALEFPFQPGARLVFADGTPDILAYPINRRGWGNLCRLLSAGNLRTTKGSCLLYEADLLEWHGEMMLAVLPDRGGGDDDAATLQGLLTRLKTACGGRVYLGLSPQYDGKDQMIFAGLSMLAEKLHVPLIATNEPLYHVPARRPLADVVTAIRHHVTIAEAGFRLAANAERHLKDGVEMARVFRAYPSALANSEKFFRRLSFSIDELQYQYPDESIRGETPAQTLRRLTWEGAEARFPQGLSETLTRQINHELALICNKQYEPYFLTIRNIMEFARSRDILCQGRGSAANSTVCYCLGITDVNPEKTTLLFERFISTERDEPPDIDVDFEHARREEVIQHIYKQYGKEHAGLTAAVTSYRTRSAGREVAKAFGLSDDVQAALAGSVWGWWTHGLSQDQADAAGLDINDPTTKRVMDYTRALMEFPRHLSQHVGGFVITRDRLDEVVPIMNTAMPDRYMIEWDKDDLEVVSIFKIDILALGMLTCLAKAFRLLSSDYGTDVTLAGLCNGHEDDVYDMICRADTIGVFQIESRAQMSMLPRLRPRLFYDLVIEVAIVRPGPIQGNMVHPYLKRREAARRGIQTTYPKPELEVVLKRTLGVPLFQEQAMQIAITAAKFTPGEADKLRRAMATFKRTGKIEEFRNKMISGMLENGYEEEFAKRCFSQIEGFGNYGFPESHAASFALLVYASSWIKTYYPDVFCVAMLNSQPMGFYAPAQLVGDARDHGVEARPVDINHSLWDSMLETGGFDAARVDPRHASMRNVILTRRAIRLGFHQVKGLNEKDMLDFVARRGDGYSSVRDLWLRSGLNRAAIERLADADAFRSIGLDRRHALWAVKALDEKSGAERLPLFDRASHTDLQKEEEMSLPVMLPGEQVIEDYRALSLSLKAHPVQFLRQAFSEQGIARNRDLATAARGRVITIAGLVLVRQRPGSANGVIFMTLEDETGVANAIVWPKVFAAYRSVVMGARVVKIRGRLQRENEVIHVVADHLEDMTHLLGLLQKERRSFGASIRADEVLRPTTDHRQTKNRPAHTPAVDAAAAAAAADAERRSAIETSKVMPKGRNFH